MASACTSALGQLGYPLQHVFREGCHDWIAGGVG